MKIRIVKGYGVGLVLGFCLGFTLAMVIVSLSGCRMEQNEALRDKLEAASDRAAARADSMYVNLRTGEVQAFDVLEDGSVVRRPPDSATNYPAIPDSWRLNHSAIPNSSAKVAAVMSANDITLPQVAAYLSQYGFDVVNRSSTLRPHWTPAPPGRDAAGNIVPVAYYVANIRIAVGDTTLAIYAPQAVGPVWMRVKAYDGRGMSGIWSVTEVSGSGDLLPGVAE